MSDRDFNEAAKRRKIEQARQEREQKERDRQREEQREAAKRKPHCLSGWDNPTFGDRVIARAERHEKILAQIRAGNYSSAASGPTARQRWDKAIQAKVSAGDSKPSAIMAVDKEYPGLRLQMLAEVNGR